MKFKIEQTLNEIVVTQSSAINKKHCGEKEMPNKKIENSTVLLNLQHFRDCSIGKKMKAL